MTCPKFAIVREEWDMRSKTSLIINWSAAYILVGAPRSYCVVLRHVWFNALGRLLQKTFTPKSYFKLFYIRGVIWGKIKSEKRRSEKKIGTQIIVRKFTICSNRRHTVVSNSAHNRSYSQQNCNSMEHSPSWEAKRLLSSQEIPRILWSPKAHYRITEFTSASHLSVSWARLIHFMPTHPISWRYIFNIILSSTPTVSKCSLSLRSLHQNPERTSSVDHTCKKQRTSPSSVWSSV